MHRAFLNLFLDQSLKESPKLDTAVITDPNDVYDTEYNNKSSSISSVHWLGVRYDGTHTQHTAWYKPYHHWVKSGSIKAAPT